jgi:ABC-2 type transport system permease protein
MLFSGRLMPIVVFPALVQSLLFFTPFRYMFSFPIEIAIGQISSPQIIQGLIIQSLWVLSVIYLQHHLWAKGLARYSASGA